MRVEKTIKLEASPSVVWDALTNPELTKQYYFGCEAISDWQVGSPLIYRCKFEGEDVVPVKGVIQAIEPNRFLRTTCFQAKFEDVPAKHTTVTYSLTSDGDATELAVSQGEFPDDESTSQHEASWDQVLAGLKVLLEGPGAS